MNPRLVSVAACALAALTTSILASPSHAYPTVEGQPARYVIITSDALAASFQPLADWKTQTGLPAVVRRMSEVIAAHPTAFDDAERVRLDIRDAYQAGAQWVLLGGGAGVVPHRYATTLFYGGPREILTDCYFQCLDGTWDADGDHRFGEGFFNDADPGDNADLVADVWLGRAPVATEEEARLFVAKTLQYVRTPAGDYEHRSLECADVLFPQDWLPGDPTFFDGALQVEALLPYFDLHSALEVTRLYENYSDPEWRPGALPESRATVLEALNRGSNQTLIVGTGDTDAISVGPGVLEAGDFLALTNGGRLSTLRILGCGAAQFDAGGIGRAALIAPDGGAVSVVGGSANEFPTALHAYLKEYYRLTYVDGVSAQGEANARSVLPFLQFATYDGVNRWTVMTQALLGDPELRVWTAPPRALDVSHDRHAFVTATAFDVTVLENSAPLEGARVAAWAAGQFLAVALTDATGAASVPIEPTERGAFKLTVTAQDARPYEATVRIVGDERMRRPGAQAQLDRGVSVAPVQLAVRVLGRQPVADAVQLELTLTGAGDARLEVLDLAGRSIASHDLQATQPGPLAFRLDATARLAPGLYWLRLTEDGHTAGARMAVVR